jgi:hypothetical protein
LDGQWWQTVEKRLAHCMQDPGEQGDRSGTEGNSRALAGRWLSLGVVCSNADELAPMFKGNQDGVLLT